MGATIVASGVPSRCSPALLVAAAALLVLWCAPPPADALCDESDKVALLSLKTSLGNPKDLVSWDDSTDCCDEWLAMECDNGGRVTSVYIQSSLDATGNISDSIANLTYLKSLVIRNCYGVTGPIPASLSKLRHLQVLNLQQNNLTGSIPDSLGQLQKLVNLSLSQNILTGTIPSSLGSLDKLAELYLDSNELTGPIPASFEALDLERVNVSFNGLSGDATPLFGEWKRTKALDISGNQFDFNLSYVEFPVGLNIINMSDNRITGYIPDNADAMEHLQQFNVSHNQLCGEIPQGGHINKFPASAFADNKFLCGSPLPRCPTQWSCADSASRLAGGPAGLPYPVAVSR